MDLQYYQVVLKPVVDSLHLLHNQEVIIASDYAFFTTRANFDKVSQFYSHLKAHEFNTRSIGFNITYLINSDWMDKPCLLKYNWLSLPQTVFDVFKIKSCKALSKNIYLLREALLHVNQSDAAKETRYASCLSGSEFESESSFYKFLLGNNLLIRRWPVHVQLGTRYDGCWGENRGSLLPPKGFLD